MIPEPELFALHPRDLMTLCLRCGVSGERAPAHIYIQRLRAMASAEGRVVEEGTANVAAATAHERAEFVRVVQPSEPPPEAGIIHSEQQLPDLQPHELPVALEEYGEETKKSKKRKAMVVEARPEDEEEGVKKAEKKVKKAKETEETSDVQAQRTPKSMKKGKNRGELDGAAERSGKQEACVALHIHEVGTNYRYGNREDEEGARSCSNEAPSERQELVFVYVYRENTASNSPTSVSLKVSPRGDWLQYETRSLLDALKEKGLFLARELRKKAYRTGLYYENAAHGMTWKLLDGDGHITEPAFVRKADQAHEPVKLHFQDPAHPLVPSG